MRSVLDVLLGRNREFVPSYTIEDITELSNNDVRTAVRELVQQGHVIVSRVHNGGGYCINPTKEQLEDDIETLKSRRRALSRRINALRKVVYA